MSKLTFKIYESECELTEQRKDSSPYLSLDFSEDISGFVCFGRTSERVIGGKCEIDLRLLENGDYTPELILSRSRVVLPLIRKFGFLIECRDCTDEYIRAASQRERALRERVSEVENKIAEIEEKVYGTVVL